MVFVKATPNSEAGFPPSEKLRKLLAEMGKFDEELAKAGLAEGLAMDATSRRREMD